MLSAMLDFVTIAVSFPALPFTVAVAVSTVFWVVSLVAGLDLGTDGADGVVDGALDGAVDGALDGAVDGAADAVGDGLIDGATDGVADGVADGIEPDSSFEVAAFLASVFRFGKVPITVWLSLFTLWGWVVAFVGGWLLRSPLLVFLPNWPGNLVVLAVATVAGVVLAGVTSRPLEPVYRSHGGRNRSSLVGEVAEITTSRVDGRFGQARIELGSDDLVVQVRCDRPNPLTRGTRALVVQFDAGRDAFVVEPLEDPKVSSRDRARDTTVRRATGLTDH